MLSLLNLILLTHFSNLVVNTIPFSVKFTLLKFGKFATSPQPLSLRERGI